MGSPAKDKNSQVTFLKQRLNMFLDVLDAIEPETTDLDDIDRLISIIDELESKCREFTNRDVTEPVK
ncbi:SE1561 family protein [Neobacillus dielmonensis]|uniref:SE1561 family protein n=1 Tax=Neobacillus dielmonensis TaxID=1347369 RepID=UPI0005A9C158|nr:SE1561 family protein [Neobacillus dielmonensis]